MRKSNALVVKHKPNRDKALEGSRPLCPVVTGDLPRNGREKIPDDTAV